MVVSRFLGKGGRCRLLALCLFAAAIYLGFQLFSVKILSSDSQKKLKHIDVAKRKNYEKVLQKLNLPLKFPNRVKKDVIHAPLKETIVKLMNLKETNIKPPNIVQNGSSKVSNEITIVNMVPPVGINPDLTLQYLKDKNGIFTCLNSKETISWLHVNDDYCDCSDGSDEPGTSACRNMQFYCSKQLIGAPVFIPSSRVNDGICDCCDGSDEWSGATVADNFRIEKDKLRYLVVHAACVSTCYRYKEASDEEKRIHKAGRKKKEEYIKYAQSMPFMEHIHGPQGVFYKLNDNCYKFKQSKYTYELCPFRESKQSTNDGHSVNIGRVPALRKSDGNFVLEMNNGDNASCPGRNYRQTVMWFKCGLEDKIVHMKEDNSCIYEFDFETPAAC